MNVELVDLERGQSPYRRPPGTPTAARCIPGSGSTRTTGRSRCGTRWRVRTTWRSPRPSGGASGKASSSRQFQAVPGSSRQFQAHYTWSRDRSNDDNERSSGDLTLTDPADPDYDWGLSSRDIPHRFVASGVFTLPFDILVSGILTAQSGSPYTALDPAVGFHNHPGFYVGPYGPQTRAVVGGELAPVNGERNDAWTNFDFRLTKRFDLGGAQLEALFEVFNVLSTAAFRVSGSDQQEPVLDDGGTPNPEFGLGSARVGAQRQAQLGLRIVF